MFESNYLNVISLIDDDITINETIHDNIYEYIKNIVDTYCEYSLTIYLNMNIFDKYIYIKVYDNTI